MASRVETKPQTAAPRWKTEGDDYKADLTAHPEEIKDLCPIVITSIDCRPTKFKDADGNILMKTLIADPEGKIVKSTEGGKYCKEWNDQVGGGIGHGYQATPDALAYYLKNMRDHCDKP